MRIDLRGMVLIAAACGSGDGRTPAKPPAPAPAPVAHVAPAPAPAPVAPSLPDEGAWTRPGIEALAFCPGDAELVAVDAKGWLTRWRVADGARLAATQLSAGETGDWRLEPPLARVDCRADGAALAVGVVGRVLQLGPTHTKEEHREVPFVVERDGAARHLATELRVLEARFGADGDPRLLDHDGVVSAWRASGAVDEVFRSDAPYPDARLGANDDYLERVFTDPGSFTRLRRGDRWIALEPSGDTPNAVETVDDGVVVQYEMSVFVWDLPEKGKKAKKGMELLDATGVHVKAIAAGARWFLAVDAGSAIVRMRRPGRKIDTIDAPCGGDGVEVLALALARDESRVAVACSDDRIRLVSL